MLFRSRGSLVYASGVSAPSPRSVFVSFARGSDARVAPVRALAARLAERGVPVVVDWARADPAEGWIDWMAREVEHADVVVAVCSVAWKRRFEGETEAGVGHGARWEGRLIRGRCYREGIGPWLVVAILPGEDPAAAIPLPLFELPRFTLDTAGIEALTDRLCARSPTAAVPIAAASATWPPVLTDVCLVAEPTDLSVAARLLPALPVGTALSSPGEDPSRHPWGEARVILLFGAATLAPAPPDREVLRLDAGVTPRAASLAAEAAIDAFDGRDRARSGWARGAIVLACGAPLATAWALPQGPVLAAVAGAAAIAAAAAALSRSPSPVTTRGDRAAILREALRRPFGLEGARLARRAWAGSAALCFGPWAATRVVETLGSETRGAADALFALAAVLGSGALWTWSRVRRPAPRVAVLLLFAAIAWQVSALEEAWVFRHDGWPVLRDILAVSLARPSAPTAYTVALATPALAVLILEGLPWLAAARPRA